MENNGHKTPQEIVETKTFNGAVVTLNELRRQDGLIAESIDKNMGKSFGVIQTILAPCDDSNYRQILKFTRWKNTEEQDKCINALKACDRTGAVKAKHVILDRLTARSAGIDAQLVNDALEALMHTTFTTENRTVKGNGNRNANNNFMSK